MAPSTPPTLPSLFLATATRRGEAVAARHKVADVWRDMSWRELEEHARATAFGFAALGVEAGDRVSLLGPTTLAWVIAELGAQMAGAVSVPVYHTNPAADVAYVLGDAGSSVVIAGDGTQLAKVLAVRGQVPSLRHVLRLDGQGTAEAPDLEDLVALGRDLRERDPGLIDRRIAALDPESAACFIYTSGTTGAPKGVVLSHRAWTFEGRVIEEMGIAGPDDVQLLFLPLAHSFAQVLKTGWFHTGHVVAFAESQERLVANLTEIRPTVMAAVPRVFEKLYARVVAKGNKARGLKGTAFRFAMHQVDRYADAQAHGRHAHGPGLYLAEHLVLNKVAASLHELLGGRLRFFISGGAPLAPAVAWFFERVGVTILEGWGLTETASATTVNRPGHNRIGTVGPPVPGMELRIADDGEVLVRGPGLMTGYHGRPDATARAFDADGWLLTGDVGAIDEDGTLRITDRKKDLIKTAGGEYVAPQALENALKTYPLVSQAVVVGDQRPYLVALLTIDPATGERWATEHGVAWTDLPTLAREPELRAELQACVDDLNRALPSFEQLRRFAVLDRDLSQETGELTPTLKVKRRVVTERFAATIDALYAEGPASRHA